MICTLCLKMQFNILHHRIPITLLFGWLALPQCHILHTISVVCTLCLKMQFNILHHRVPITLLIRWLALPQCHLHTISVVCYILFPHIIGYHPSTIYEYDMIKCMLTLSDQSYIAFCTPAIILSINILFPFFRLEQNIVR